MLKLAKVKKSGGTSKPNVHWNYCEEVYCYKEEVNTRSSKDSPIFINTTSPMDRGSIIIIDEWIGKDGKRRHSLLHIDALNKIKEELKI